MSNTELKQHLEDGTANPAWLAARVGRVTGSMIGGVLGVSPFASRQASLKRMVKEAMGESDFFTNEAMRWGTEHEAEACKLYAAMYAGNDKVVETGFWELGDLGASPDRLVGDRGMLEVKCPFAIREEISPKFKVLADVPHYEHQMQLQMLCADRDWVDFLQWTPHDHSLVRVERNPNWLDENMESISTFIQEYEDLMEVMVKGGPADKLKLSDGWQAARIEYISAKAESERAAERLTNATTGLTSLMAANKIKEIDEDDFKVMKMSKKGSVSWKKIAEGLASPEILAERSALPANIGKGSSSWKITIKK